MTAAADEIETETSGASYDPAADWTNPHARVSRVAELPGWRFEQDARGDWRGIHDDGRHTGLKFGLRAVRDAAARGDVVCRSWPDCEHAQPARAQTDDRQNAPGTHRTAQDERKRASSVLVSPSGTEQLTLDL